MYLYAIFCCKYKKNIDSCQEFAPNFLQYLTHIAAIRHVTP